MSDMEVKVPGFDLTLKAIWIIAGIVWSALLVGVTSYITYKTTLSHIENKVENTTDEVSGLSTTFKDRIKVTDLRFEKLETGQNQINEKVSAMAGDVKGVQGDLKGVSKQLDNMVLLMSALLKDKVADNSTPVVHDAVYEVRR